MSRKNYLPAVVNQRSYTNPPQAMDIKYYSVYVDPNDDFQWDPEFVNFSFTFFDTSDINVDDRSAPYEFQIEIENIDTGVIKNFVQLYNQPYYTFWQRQAEVYTESPIGDEIDLTEEAIVNSRVTVTPVNDFGIGEKSVFFLPFKDLVWTRSKDNKGMETFSVLDRNWSLFSEKPLERENRPKIVYIYLDVSEEDIQKDVVKLSLPKWQFTSLTDSKTINKRTFRWRVTDLGHRRLSRFGWRDSTEDETQFITDLIQTMLPAYRDYVTRKQIDTRDPHIFKIAIENPEDNKDTILIYLMKGAQWAP